MLNKNDILSSLLSEIEIVRHLATKVPAGGMDYRPSEGQRSTLEVLRYLCSCAAGGTSAMVDGNWDGYKKWSASVAEMTGEGVSAALDLQIAGLKEAFAAIPDGDFATRMVQNPLGQEFTLGRALMEMPVKWMTAYRMQLFLQAKAAGSTDIGTYNCWGGMDAPVQAS